MWSKIKSLIIFALIVGVLAVGYAMFIKKPKNEGGLVSETTLPTADKSTETTAEDNAKLGQDFLTLLFSLKSINLDGSLFGSATFGSLKDSSIILVPDGTEGRPNPFAPIGAENNASTALVNDFLTNSPQDKTETDGGLLFPGTEVKPAPQTTPTPTTTPKKKTN